MLGYNETGLCIEWVALYFCGGKKSIMKKQLWGP